MATKGNRKYSREFLLALALVTMLLVLVACNNASSSSVSSTASTPAVSPVTGQSVTINLTANNIAFDTNKITVPAGAKVTMNFDNQDGMPHNFALYTNSSASSPVFVGQTIGKGKIVYEFTAPAAPGTYFFRCDVHPVTMTGSFIVR